MPESNRELDDLLAELDALTTEEEDRRSIEDTRDAPSINDQPIRAVPTDQSPPVVHDRRYTDYSTGICRGTPRFPETPQPEPDREPPHQHLQRRSRFMARQAQLAERERNNRPPHPEHDLHALARHLNLQSHGANLWNANLTDLLEYYLGPQAVILLEDAIQRHGPMTESDLIQLVTSTIERFIEENPDNPHFHNLFNDVFGGIPNANRP